jgi:hypothetical protein
VFLDFAKPRLAVKRVQRYEAFSIEQM